MTKLHTVLGTSWRRLWKAYPNACEVKDGVLGSSEAKEALMNGSLETLRSKLRTMADPEKAKALQRFFKTGPGEYGEGDVFLGIQVPALRKLAKENPDLDEVALQVLLRSSIHEERMLSLLILIQQYVRGTDQEREKLYGFYLANTAFINNWDLVDVSAEHVVGHFLMKGSKRLLYQLAKSSSLWERRIAILATFHFIKQHEFSDTLKIAAILLSDKEDLIQKAMGWMLREVGKRDLEVEEHFLRERYQKMPRTMLRYAIERFPAEKRNKYLKGQM
jgi:3-methyladenine DNA glycosylase AlkD